MDGVLCCQLGYKFELEEPPPYSVGEVKSEGRRLTA